MQATRATKDETGAEAVHFHLPSPIIPVAKSSGHANDHSHNHDHEHHHKKSPKGSGHEHDHSPGYDHDLEHHHKKSVLAKVKEKAKKWRQMLINKKKHGHEHSGSTVPQSPISLDEEDECVGQYPEYYGAPMYQSEMAPKMYKERALQFQATQFSPKTPTSVLGHGPDATSIQVPSPKPVLDHGPAATGIEVPPPVQPPLHAHEAVKEITSQHEAAVPSPATPNSMILHSPATGVPVPLLVPLPQEAHDEPKEPKLQRLDSFKETSTGLDLVAPATARTLATETETEEDEPASANIGSKSSSKTLTETVTEMLAPAYNMVSEATSMIAAKIQSPTARDEVGAKMKWDKDGGKMKSDKGVSVKEYLLQKLEPGEEEKALSEVITEAISPRNMGQGEDVSVVEKVKGAVSSLLGKEEQMGMQQVQMPTSSPSSSRPLFKGAQGTSVLVSTYKDGDSYPASKSTHEALVTDNAHGGLISPSKHTRKASILSSKHTHGASVPSSASATLSSGHAPGASITETKRTHGAIPTSEGSHGASLHAPQFTHTSSIPASKHKRRVSISNCVDILGDSSPLPVSTNPSIIQASTNSPPIPLSKHQSPSQFKVSTNPSTIRNSAIPHTEVEETSERRLQAYAN